MTEQRTKIVFVIYALRTGGAESVVTSVANFLAGSHDVHIVLFENVVLQKLHNITITSLDSPVRQSRFGKFCNIIQRIFRLAKVFTQLQPDRIISFMESASLPSAIAALITGNSVRHSVAIRTNPKFMDRQHRWLIGLLYRWCDRIIFNSKGACDVYRTWFPSLGAKCSVIYNPVNFERILQLSEQKPSTDLPKNYFVCLGRLETEKRFQDAIQAFAMADLPSDCQLFCIGDGSQRAFLHEQAAKFEVTDRIHFVGHQENPYNFLKHAHALILTSVFEGWPNVINDALTCGCPVISYDIESGPNEIIVNGCNGYLVSNGNIEELSRTINRLFNENQNAESRTKFERNCQNSVEKFRVNTLAPQWLIQS